MNVYNAVKKAGTWCVEQGKSLVSMTAAGSTLVVSQAHAAVAPLDVAPATSYLESNVGDNLILIGGVLFALAALAMGIKWIKAAIFG
jgi:hypothetical protein